MTSVRQLRYFVEIAEQGSFTAAADRLHVAQSALSRQIKELEEHLGTMLFERTARQPRLTLSGQAFLGRARSLLVDLAKAERLVQEVGKGIRGSVRMNHSSTVPLAGPLLKRLGVYLGNNPGVTIDIAQQSSEGQLEDIAEHRLEIGLLRLPVLRQHAEVELHTLFCEPLLLAVSAQHSLAGEIGVSLNQLREERFISLPHPQRGGLSYLSASLCMEADFFPQAAQVTSRKTTQLQLIAANFGVAILPQCMRAIAPSSVHFVPLTDKNCNSTVVLACRTDTEEVVQQLTRVLRQDLLTPTEN
jgi:DNA-binding transcriptional LysR family regulator